MDFHSLSRKELQALCKINKIPANMTNVAMADALAARDTVEGLEEVLSQSQSGALKTPAKGVSESARPAVRSTRKKPTEVETIVRTRRMTRTTQETDEENTNIKLLQTPSVASSRRRAPATAASRVKEAEAQKQEVCSTRRSVRVLEKSVSQLSIKGKGTMEPVEIEQFEEEICLEEEKKDSLVADKQKMEETLEKINVEENNLELADSTQENNNITVVDAKIETDEVNASLVEKSARVEEPESENGDVMISDYPSEETNADEISATDNVSMEVQASEISTQVPEGIATEKVTENDGNNNVDVLTSDHPSEETSDDEISVTDNVSMEVQASEISTQEQEHIAKEEMVVNGNDDSCTDNVSMEVQASEISTQEVDDIGAEEVTENGNDNGDFMNSDYPSEETNADEISVTNDISVDLAKSPGILSSTAASSLNDNVTSKYEIVFNDETMEDDSVKSPALNKVNENVQQLVAEERAPLVSQFPRPNLPTPEKPSINKLVPAQNLSVVADDNNKENTENMMESKVQATKKQVDYESASLRQLTKMVKEMQLTNKSKKDEDKQVPKISGQNRVALQTLSENN